MIQGVVSDRFEARIGIDVIGPDRALRLEAVIDTGFNGNLSLEAGVIRALGLQSAGVRKGMLANGAIVEFEAYRAKILWDGTERRITAVKSARGNLLGMKLLKGLRLVIDVEKQGSVTIEPLSRSEPGDKGQSQT